jgi:GAF domain-containing protein
MCEVEGTERGHGRELRDESDQVVGTVDSEDSRIPSDRALFEYSPLPYLVTDTRGVILEANNAAGALLGRLPAELSGVPIAGFSGPPPGGIRRVVAAAVESPAPRAASLSMRPPRRPARQVRITVQRHTRSGREDLVLLWQLHPSPTAEPIPVIGVDATIGASSMRSVAEQVRSLSPEQVPAGREALVEALVELENALIAETGLREALTGVAVAAGHGVAGTDGSSVTLLEPPNVGASSLEVEAADRIQYDEQQGPCVTAMEEGHTVVADDLADDERWPVVGPRLVLEAGFRSVLSVPLLDGDEVHGGLNLYAIAPRSFGPLAVASAELFARPAEARLANVRAYRASLHVADELRKGLVSRAVIDQAKGMLMSRHGLDADQAFAVLTRFSQQENRKLRDVAADLVASSVRDGRNRHRRGTDSVPNG